MIKWTARQSRFQRSEDWTGHTPIGPIEITRVSYKVLGTPWRLKFPTGHTLPVASADLAKELAEQWLAERGKRKERK